MRTRKYVCGSLDRTILVVLVIEIKGTEVTPREKSAAHMMLCWTHIMYVHACFCPLMHIRKYVCVQVRGYLWLVATKSRETYYFDVNFCGRMGVFLYASHVPSKMNSEQCKLLDLE